MDDPTIAPVSEAAVRYSIQEREDDMLIAREDFQFGWRCIARRPALMKNDDWRPEAERIVAALSTTPAAPANGGVRVGHQHETNAPVIGDRRMAIKTAAYALAPFSADPPGTFARDALVILNAAISPAARDHFAATPPIPEQETDRAFRLGDCVTKRKGSSWTGRVVGFYSTSLTPIGYAVESENELGSVQIYPENALTLKETDRG